jgi:hypothetical protein
MLRACGTSPQSGSITKSDVRLHSAECVFAAKLGVRRSRPPLDLGLVGELSNWTAPRSMPPILVISVTKIWPHSRCAKPRSVDRR